MALCCPIWCPILKLLEIQRFPGSPPGGANTVAGGTPALQRHGSRGEEGLGWEGEEGEEVDLRANGEATREAKGVGEQEEQAVHGEAKGPTKRQHKGLRPRNGRGLSSLNNWKKHVQLPNTEIQLDCSTDNHSFDMYSIKYLRVLSNQYIFLLGASLDLL